MQKLYDEALMDDSGKKETAGLFGNFYRDPLRL